MARNYLVIDRETGRTLSFGHSLHNVVNMAQKLGGNLDIRFDDKIVAKVDDGVTSYPKKKEVQWREVLPTPPPKPKPHPPKRVIRRKGAT